MTATTHTPAYQRGTERCTIVRGDGDALTIYDRDQATIAELVAALRDCVIAINRGGGPQLGASGKDHGIVDRARAALARVQA